MKDQLCVLQVEDRNSDALLIQRVLEKAGHTVRSKRIEDAAGMRAALLNQAWDIVICDYALPQFDAPAALKVLRETGLDIPFIVVSGTIGEDIAVGMMRSGAHDYIMKDNLARLPVAVEREIAEARLRLERRQAQVQLRHSEALLRAVCDNAAAFYFFLRGNESPEQEAALLQPAGIRHDPACNGGPRCQKESA